MDLAASCVCGLAARAALRAANSAGEALSAGGGLLHASQHGLERGNLAKRALELIGGAFSGGVAQAFGGALHFGGEPLQVGRFALGIGAAQLLGQSLQDRRALRNGCINRRIGRRRADAQGGMPAKQRQRQHRDGQKSRRPRPENGRPAANGKVFAVAQALRERQFLES